MVTLSQARLAPLSLADPPLGGKVEGAFPVSKLLPLPLQAL
ncbi:hypothetical protein TSC_c00350 [Thermus scotoductus SA-01]|uniref:Uncharacterized protein n=1 Tax=Thermus scotoductus (strain ATCC 700910 / SA-01) TaxID=743525 RepID=E8PR27_THESS|nr:hypothetical protein TSC_c00350 [Thermus scotoductus SA-01]